VKNSRRCGLLKSCTISADNENMTKPKDTEALPEPITINCRDFGIDDLLGREWLLTNQLGSYASSTVIGCNTRRYHGLLVAATLPPVGRVSGLATVMEQVALDGGESFDLATNEFDGTLSPRGEVNLLEFRNEIAPTFVYKLGEATLTKQIMLSDTANAVAIRYTLRGASGRMELRPFASLRDFHHLRQFAAPSHMTFEPGDGGVVVQDRAWPQHSLRLASSDARFQSDPQWWYRLKYRVDLSRGQDGYEDLYTPGPFVFQLSDGQTVQFNAALDAEASVGFTTAVENRQDRLTTILQHVSSSQPVTRQLAVAADQFVVRRAFPGEPGSATILAGYPWFADWGRDAFIALPGLLLSTGRLSEAEEVFATFARHVDEGVVPNRFDDYSSSAHYNSIDASLWFMIAADRFLEAGGNRDFWRSVILPAEREILTRFHDGTKFDIHADADGLLIGGDLNTQLTWMDAKLGDEVITPRHGKAVEVNAMWYCAHAALGQRLAELGDASADRYQSAARQIADAFNAAFWNPQASCLYDCITDGKPDASLRPNQVLAVSLPHSPLPDDRQEAVLAAVAEHLLTPLGLRTLSPRDSRYRRRYGGSWEGRDRAYHQGTVWAWLIGPYVEALLRVHDNSPLALRQGREALAAFDEHLRTACLGQISEIFDGDRPHTPRGCFAQAWSVGEVLRARLLLEQLGAYDE
jgi:predicted glycogen debranching enzyme